MSDHSTIGVIAGVLSGAATAIWLATVLWEPVYVFIASIAAINPVPWILPRELVLTLETASGVVSLSLAGGAIVGALVVAAVDAAVARSAGLLGD